MFIGIFFTTINSSKYLIIQLSNSFPTSFVNLVRFKHLLH